MELSAGTIDQVERRLATVDGREELELVRVVAQAHAYRSGEAREVRLRWAKLSLTANARLPGDSPWDHVRRRCQDFALRAWIIEQLGPDTAPDWDPAALAADTLAALALDPDHAAALSATWRDLPIGQVNELRQHKNLTAHLDTLLGHLHAGPTKDRLAAWLGVRARLP